MAKIGETVKELRRIADAQEKLCRLMAEFVSVVAVRTERRLIAESSDLFERSVRASRKKSAEYQSEVR